MVSLDAGRFLSSPGSEFILLFFFYNSEAKAEREPGNVGWTWSRRDLKMFFFSKKITLVVGLVGCFHAPSSSALMFPKNSRVVGLLNHPGQFPGKEKVIPLSEMFWGVLIPFHLGGRVLTLWLMSDRCKDGHSQPHGSERRKWTPQAAASHWAGAMRLSLTLQNNSVRWGQFRFYSAMLVFKWVRQFSKDHTTV